MEMIEIASYLKEGPTFVFALLVYFEMRSLRHTLVPILNRLDERVREAHNK